MTNIALLRSAYVHHASLYAVNVQRLLPSSVLACFFVYVAGNVACRLHGACPSLE